MKQAQDNWIRVGLRLADINLTSTIQKLPFALPPTNITVRIISLATLALGLLAGSLISKVLVFSLSIVPPTNKFMIFHTIFAIAIYLPLVTLYPTIAPTSGRLQYLSRLPLSPQLLGFCLASPVIFASFLLALVFVPGFTMAAVVILKMSYPVAGLILCTIAVITFMHAQLTYIFTSNLAVRFSNLSLDVSTITGMFSVGYIAVLVLTVRESFTGNASRFSGLAAVVLRLFQWPLIADVAIVLRQWLPLVSGILFILAIFLFTGMLPFSLAPRVTSGFGRRGGWLLRILPYSPLVVFFIRFSRAPRCRETVRVLTLLIGVIIIITYQAPLPLRPDLSGKLIYVLAVFAGSISALCGSTTTASVESYEFQLGLSKRKKRAASLSFSLIYAIGRILVLGVIASIMLNQPPLFLIKILIVSTFGSFVGYWYGVKMLPRSYTRTPTDSFPLVVCSFAISGITFLAETLTFPIGSFVSGVVIALILVVTLAYILVPGLMARSKRRALNEGVVYE